MVIGITCFNQYKTYAAHGNPSDPGYIEYKGYDTIYLDDSGNFIYQKDWQKSYAKITKMGIKMSWKNISIKRFRLCERQKKE